MRDVLITLLIFGTLPFILKRPYIGVLVWSWISYMNPHRLTWGFAYNVPFAQIVAVTLLISLLFSKEKKTIPVDGFLIVWIIFLVWITITTLFAIEPVRAFAEYQQVIKIQLMTFVTMMCMRDIKRIHMLVCIICISIGYYSVKGGLFTVLTAGHYRVYGPPQSFIRENNALALATLMVIPLMYYLQSVSQKKWVKLAWLASMLVSCVSALGSQSRGALLALLSLGGYFWLQTRAKIISGVSIVTLGFLAFTFMPQSWHDRMDTIRNYQEDLSAMGRLGAWDLSRKIAEDRFIGGGFAPFTLDVYEKYLHPVEKPWVAHSIYFSMLACHGWPGLIIFLIILALTWRNLTKIGIATKGDPRLRNINILSRMLKLSLLAFMTGGAFLSLGFFDLPWHIIAIAFLLKHQLLEDLQQQNSALPVNQDSRCLTPGELLQANMAPPRTNRRGKGIHRGGERIRVMKQQDKL
jgi:putative inorganic carbon (HCO3(-)) transporter